MIVAHEFFDALPIYKFEKTADGWRELVVDLEEEESSSYHLRFVLAPGPTQASKAIAEHPAYDHFHPGDRIEVSPDSFRVMLEMAQHIGKNSGSALIVDYGKDHIQGDTLRVRSPPHFLPPPTTLSKDALVLQLAHYVLNREKLCGLTRRLLHSYLSPLGDP
jgi:SAM-dependent MidA family methyltransferase